ncbi:MAG: NAD-dependent epimerase/dehydratase family protein, partial [Cyclobacteriaceae bacterium]|nr:NAD-dependent epimerase/dehydratase family protein [Cyclobacteriaceae bacterium]
DRLKAWAVNATASFELLELSMQYKAEKFFFPSTVVTYGGQLTNPLPEDFPQWPVSIYGATKVAVERMGSYYHSKFGLDFRALRLPFVISGFAPSGALTAYASHVFNEAVNGKDFEFPVNENTAVSTIYVKDVIKGILQLLDAPDEKLTRRVYNVHAFSPAALPIGQAIKKHLPDFNFTFSPDENVLRITGAMPEVMDDHSAREDWGWDPQYDLDKMTKDFIDALHHKK